MTASMSRLEKPRKEMVLRKQNFKLSKEKTRKGLENSYSFWKEAIAGVLQRSVLGRLLLNIFVNDLFLFPKTCNLADYADDNTLYAAGDCIEVITEFSPVLVS